MDNSLRSGWALQFTAYNGLSGYYRRKEISAIETTLHESVTRSIGEIVKLLENKGSAAMFGIEINNKNIHPDFIEVWILIPSLAVRKFAQLNIKVQRNSGAIDEFNGFAFYFLNNM